MKSTSVLKTGERDMSGSGTHHPPEFKHAEDTEWEMGRFGNVTKFLFVLSKIRPPLGKMVKTAAVARA
jgi:hypothetical protein